MTGHLVHCLTSSTLVKLGVGVVSSVAASEVGSMVRSVIVIVAVIVIVI